MPDSLLASGEVVLRVTRRPLITLVVSLLLIATAGRLLLTQTCAIAVAVQLDGRCPLVVGVTVTAMALPFVLDWFTTRFVVTNQRVLLQQPLWLFVRSLDLSAIEAVSLQQGLLGELFGFGDGVIDRAATEGGRLVFDGVPQPTAVLTLLAAARARRRSRRVGSG
jgi:hypothetical protein